MANPTGKSGPRDKPFRDALRMELASAGDDHKKLRAIARNLIALAEKNDPSAMAAIREIADRTDGKAVQAVEVGKPGDFEQMSDDELEAFIAGREGLAGAGAGRERTPDRQAGVRGKSNGVH